MKASVRQLTGMPWIVTFRVPTWWMMGGIPPRITVWGVMAEHLSWMSTEVFGQAHLTNQGWPSSVLIVSLPDCQLSMSNDTMLSLHVLPKLKIWKSITSVQVDHSCRNSPCFNLCFSYLKQWYYVASCAYDDSCIWCICWNKHLFDFDFDIELNYHILTGTQKTHRWKVKCRPPEEFTGFSPES